MKIMQVIPTFGFGGAEIMCENLCYELKHLGHDVIIVSLYDYHSEITERIEENGLNITYLNKKLGLDISMIPKLRKLIKKYKPDVIHTHLDTLHYVAPATVFSKTNCMVHTVHNVAEKERSHNSRRIYKLIFRAFNATPVALSMAIHNSIYKAYKIKKENIPIVLNGISLSKCIIKNNYILSDKFTIIHVGRFAKQKNHLGLLNAFKIFNNKYPDSKLWLIGDGETRTDAEDYVNSSGLAYSVKFLGLQDNVHKYLSKADIFTLPSLYEGVPMTLIEAMGTGLPIVATNVGGVPDMLENNFNAILTDVDSAEIAEAFERYYLDENLRKTHGENALKRSIDFSSIKMAEEYCKVYSKCILKKRNGV